MRPRCVHHIAVKVVDLAAAERFYVSLLGLPILRRWPAADRPGDRSLWLDLGGDAFLAVERAEASAPSKPENSPGLHLLALAIPRAERDAWMARLAAAGHPVYHQTDYTLYTRDPEGNRVALSHWPDSA
jgi:glyoxylase I family protein